MNKKIRRMSNRVVIPNLSTAVLTLAGVLATSVWAQEPGGAELNAHDHHAMPSTDDNATASPPPAMDHGAMSMDMNMQGGSAPADARDPHAYADGITLDAGPYALPGPRQLRLADEHHFWSILFDRLEYVDRDADGSTAYDAQTWFGGTYDRLVLKAEGDIANGKLEDSRTELVWGHAIATYWDSQLGVRHDTSEGPNRDWFAVGVQGIAPYWFEVDATAYVGEQGRTALRLQAEYELLFTQRLILQPRLELNAYGEDDVATGVGSGLSDSAIGVRLRYEIKRQLAPYIGVEWRNKYGGTADQARIANLPTSETQWVAGVRFWF